MLRSLTFESEHVVNTKMGKSEGSDPHRGITGIIHFPQDFFPSGSCFIFVPKDTASGFHLTLLLYRF